MTDFGLALGVGGRFWAGDPSKYKECYVTVTIHRIFDMADGLAADDDADGMTEGVAPRGEPPCLEEQYYFTPEQATEAIAALADLWRCRDQRSDVIRGGWQGEDDARDGSAKAPNGYWWQALARTLW